MILETLKLIKEKTGLDLMLCDYFTGLKKSGDRNYFNIILSERTSESLEFTKLKVFTNKLSLISVEPNGLKRVAIFIN